MWRREDYSKGANAIGVPASYQERQADVLVGFVLLSRGSKTEHTGRETGAPLTETQHNREDIERR